MRFAVLFAISFATNVASLTLDERMDWSAQDPKGYLNFEIQQHLLEIPRMIDTAVEKSEKDLTSFVIQRKSQGWAIITASWADVYSRYFSNDQTLYKLYKKAIEEGNFQTLSNYGFFYSYGLGFGLPLIIGLPETVLTCGRQDFEDLIEDYGLERGLQPLLNEGYTQKDLKSIVKEFSIILPAKMRCIDEYKNLESMKVQNSFKEFVSAMTSRLQYDI